MLTNHKSRWFFTGLISVLTPMFAAGQSVPAATATDLAQRQVTAYLAKLADLHCSESVTQEKLTANGHVETSERAKYDYLVMIDGSGDGLQFNESRIESSSSKHKQLPMLVTNGFSTALLIFHPYYRESFTFTTGPVEMVDGKLAIPIYFSHIHGRRTPVALALRGREFPLELKGTAWLDKQSGEVLKMDVGLLHDMSDIGLKSLNIRVEYKPTMLGKSSTRMDLPSVAIVDVATPLQHWRNTHVFDAYKSFTTEAEQNSNVVIHAETSMPGLDNTAAVVRPDSKEKP
jgi:hypothetical protein